MTTILESLNNALHRVMGQDERVHILGEDILDPYGGAFKVTRGLSTAFPQRVHTTPVSEAGIVGIATGMALGGLLPVVEIMFGDFVTLIADQVINHLAKFRWMYNDQVRVPVVIRTPMGGRRGYGPTHSQSLEKLFLGVPGVRVLAVNSISHPGDLLTHAILVDENPVLFIENKLLYAVSVLSPEDLSDFSVDYEKTQEHNGPVEESIKKGDAPTYRLTIREAPPPDITLAAYGHMAHLAIQATQRLAYEHEIFTELIIPTQLTPFAISPILTSVRRTHRLIAIEEGNLTLGWGAEILARCVEALGDEFTSGQRLAATDTPIPASRPLEMAALPGVDDIISSVREIIRSTPEI